MNILLAMLPAFLWGTTYAVTQFTLPDWPPLLLGCLRALPAGLLLLAVRPALPKKRDWPGLFQTGTINIGLFFAMIFIMAATLPSAISGVGMVSVPVFAMGFQWIVARKRPNIIQLLSGAVVIALACLLFDPGALSLSATGLLAMLLAIMCIITGSHLTQKHSQKLHWWSVLTWQLIIGGTLLGIAALIQALVDASPYQQALANITTLNLAGLGWLILFNTAFAYGLYVWLLQRMSIVEFTFSGIANPLAGVICGVWLVSESYTLAQYSLMAGMVAASLLPGIAGRLRRNARTQSDSAAVSR